MNSWYFNTHLYLVVSCNVIFIDVYLVLHDVIPVTGYYTGHLESIDLLYSVFGFIWGHICDFYVTYISRKYGLWQESSVYLRHKFTFYALSLLQKSRWVILFINRHILRLHLFTCLFDIKR